MRAHFWLFTEVVRKIAGAVTRKNDGPTKIDIDIPKYFYLRNLTEHVTRRFNAILAELDKPEGAEPC